MMSTSASQPRRSDDQDFQSKLYEHVDDLVAYVDRYIPKRLRTLIDATDVVQDTFAFAARAASHVQLEDRDAAWRWLATIARNRLSDLVSSARRVKRGGGLLHLAEDELRLGSVIIQLQDLALHERTPSKSVARREFVLVLDAALSRILPRYREAVRLRYVEGMSLAETAAALQRSEESARKLCARGLEALRVELRTVSLYV